MKGTESIVVKWPTSTLMDAAGKTLVHRADLDAEEAAQRLTLGRCATGIVDVGRPIRWVKPEERFTLWKRELKSRLAGKGAFRLEDYPEGRAYTASSWTTPEGQEVLILFAHH